MWFKQFSLKTRILVSCYTIILFAAIIIAVIATFSGSRSDVTDDENATESNNSASDSNVTGEVELKIDLSEQENIKNEELLSREGEVESYLRSILNRNYLNPSLQNTPAQIRTDSFRTEYFSEDKVHQDRFIVDFPDLRQSYQVIYTYSTENDAPRIDFPIAISCLPESELIYGSFSCNEMGVGP
jgi:hypothetical protein